MVSKCANPSCSTPFRYLHEGRIVALEFTVETPVDSGDVRPQRRIEPFWLCPHCCGSFTLTVDHGKVVTRPLRERRSVHRNAA
jgi:hypothetical protein